MSLKAVLVMFHRAVAKVVLGKRNIDLDADCKKKSLARREALTRKLEKIEARTEKLCSVVGTRSGNGS